MIVSYLTSTIIVIIPPCFSKIEKLICQTLLSKVTNLPIFHKSTTASHPQSTILSNKPCISPRLISQPFNFLIIIFQFQIASKHFMQKSFPNTECSKQLVQYSESSYQRSLREENEIIEMYLNQEVFYHKSSQRTEQAQEVNFNNQQEKSESTSALSTLSPSQPQITHNRKRSIFHNFQKHLITIIKKYMSISKTRASTNEDLLIAYQLWQAFMKTNSFNKRLLHIVFGVETGTAPKEGMQRLYMEFPEFQRVSSRYSQERIISAQTIIREHMVQQASHLSKFFLKFNSSITKFDQFYEYYSNFIKEIQNGPMSKRMAKSSKQTLIQTIRKKHLS